MTNNAGKNASFDALVSIREKIASNFVERVCQPEIHTFRYKLPLQNPNIYFELDIFMTFFFFLQMGTRKFLRKAFVIRLQTRIL